MSESLDPLVRDSLRPDGNAFIARGQYIAGIGSPPYHIASIAERRVLPAAELSLPEGYNADVLATIQVITGYYNKDVTISGRQASELAEIGGQILALNKRESIQPPLGHFEKQSIGHLVMLVTQTEKVIRPGPHAALCQKWEEVEQGWGKRPDGFSLHLSEEGLDAFVQAYLERQGITPHTTGGPKEYSHPLGKVYPAGISARWYRELQGEEHASMIFPQSWKLPGSGGIDGWMPVQRGQVGPDMEQ